MSSSTSRYELDLVLNDDKTRDTIQSLKKSLNNISSGMNFEDAKKEAERLGNALNLVAKDTSESSAKIIDQFSKDSKKAIRILESQYMNLKSKQESVREEYENLTEEYKKQKIIYEDQNALESERLEAANKMIILSKQIEKNNFRELESQINSNRELRAKIKALDNASKYTHSIAKHEEKYKEITTLKNKLEKAQNENKRKFLKFISKADTDEIKCLKEKIKLLENEEKQEKKIGQAVKEVAKEQEKATVKQGGKLQNLYNVTGIIGGVGRTVGGALRAASGVARVGAGVLGQGLSAASSVADREVEKERLSNRVKGMSPADARNMLSELYIRTGADYSTIVDAINSVQTTLKGASKEDIISAAEIEMRYPGMSAAFASTTTNSNMGNFNTYANRMKAIQKATGASDEQIQSSTQMFANMRASKFGNASVTEMQSIYLALQNSGAFESQDELDAAFNRFIRHSQNSKENVVELASRFDWSSGIHNGRNKLQAQNTFGQMNWANIISSASLNDSSSLKKTESEQMAANMRRMEEQKNKLLMTLIPAAIPLVEALAGVLDGDGAKEIANGMGAIFKTVVPVLIKVLEFFDTYILQNLKKAMEWLAGKFDEDEDSIISRGANAVQKSANGGIVTGPTLVGERAFQPEMILPLDYSRSARAGNIIQTVSQTFNMSGNQTTALSLSQAVQSRDFRRATTQSAFLYARGGLA